MTDECQQYKPGDTVPESGIYDVFHDSLDGHEHAHPHEVTAIRGKLFPPCRACHAHVRFRLHHPPAIVDRHDLFRR
jgi:hypothetical protein